MPQNNPSQISKIPKTSGRIFHNLSLSSLTWFKTGGKADLFFIPKGLEDLQKFLIQLDEITPTYILGAGSNTLFRDYGFDGVVIKLGKDFDYLETSNKRTIKVGAATNCIKLARKLAKKGIAGLEFFSGIPGTVGGAIKMNAGAYGRETSEFLEEIKVISKSGTIKKLKIKDYVMKYRETNFPEDCIFIEAKFFYKKNNIQENLNKIKELNKIRNLTQPIKEKTGGSTFKNPKNLKAWQLIQNSGCKSFRVGNATLSKIHSNFIVNNGGATSSNIEDLGEKIRKRVFEKSGINLNWEIKIVGKKMKRKLS